MLDTYDSQSGITLTGRAVQKVYDITKQNPEEFVRVHIEGGGCSGFMYGFSITNEISEDDIHIADINFVVDTLSYQYIENSTIDYEETIMGSRFLVTNPQASTTCGCGQSFSI